MVIHNSILAISFSFDTYVLYFHGQSQYRLILFRLLSLLSTLPTKWPDMIIAGGLQTVFMMCNYCDVVLHDVLDIVAQRAKILEAGRNAYLAVI